MRILTQSTSCNTSSPTQLSVDLHTDVGDVLRRCGHDVPSLKNLRGHAETDVAGFFDAAIHINVAVIHNKDQEARSVVIAITGRIPGLLDCRLLIW